MTETTKTCSRCGSPKPLDDFKTDTRKPDGKASSCKACNSVPKVADLPVARSRALVPVYDPLDPKGWITRISERWRASVEAIFDVGRLLIEAKESLPHGAFGAMIESALPFSASTAQRLMAISADARLSNPAHVQHLPAQWSTLYELTKLSDDEFNSAIEQHVIRPDMIRGEAEQIRPLVRRHSSDESESRVGDSPRPRGESLQQGLDTSSILGTADHSPQGEGTGAASVANPGEHPASAPHVPSGTSETIMPSGGLAIAHRRDNDDDPREFFPTPPWATRALVERVLRHLRREGQCKFQTMWEPACGEGHMAEVLREYFRHVDASDAFEYKYRDASAAVFKHDFLTETNAEAYDWIITNPPFRKSTEFVLKAIALAGTGVAMFVRLSWVEGVARYEKLLRDNPPSLLSIFTERAPLHKARWEPDGSTFTAYAWLVWIKGMPPQPPFWIPPGCRLALAKPDDVKRFGKTEIVEDEAA